MDQFLISEFPVKSSLSAQFILHIKVTLVPNLADSNLLWSIKKQMWKPLQICSHHMRLFGLRHHKVEFIVLKVHGHFLQISQAKDYVTLSSCLQKFFF